MFETILSRLGVLSVHMCMIYLEHKIVVTSLTLKNYQKCAEIELSRI